MARVAVMVDGVVIREVVLFRARTTIGRRAHNDIRIEDPYMSGEQSVIVHEDGQWRIEDLGSRNGTRLNGKPVRRHVLKSNDLIEYGDYKLSFVADAEDLAENYLVARLVKSRPMRTLR